MPTDLQSHDDAPSLAESGSPADSGAGADSVPNAVFLSGEVTVAAEERDLAGGIHAVRWTLRVQRGASGPGTDLIDCVALEPSLQEEALGWPEGVTLAVEGALRRRFFRSSGRTTTRVEVEAHQVTVLAAPLVGVEQAEQ